MTNAECLRLVIDAISGDYTKILELVKSLESKHNSREFKALLDDVVRAVQDHQP